MIQKIRFIPLALDCRIDPRCLALASIGSPCLQAKPGSFSFYLSNKNEASGLAGRA